MTLTVMLLGSILSPETCPLSTASDRVVLISVLLGDDAVLVKLRCASVMIDPELGKKIHRNLTCLLFEQESMHLDTHTDPYT